LEGPGVWQTLGKRKKKNKEKKREEEKQGGGLESGKLWGKKKKKKEEYIHTHSYTQVVVHISMYDGEEA
jgi:hypothetical protein